MPGDQSGKRSLVNLSLFVKRSYEGYARDRAALDHRSTSFAWDCRSIFPLRIAEGYTRSVARDLRVSRSEKLAYGVHAVLEALQTGEATAVFFTEQGREAHPDLLSLANAHGLKTEIRDEVFFTSQIGKVPHQGVMARVKPYAYGTAAEALSQPGPLVALAGIENPGNLGAVIRTAAAFGIRSLLLEDAGSVRVNASVRRAAAGYLHRVRIARCDLSTVVADRGERQWLALDPRAELTITECLGAADRQRLGLLFGAEGKGIAPEALHKARWQARIPIAADVESLNLAVAVGICLFALQP
ncbi:MAG: RNA methyltransferase [Armatimonadetes bacterium]|nr:MAG: RNA methyltransferase [Armatimonadota bacterium]